MTRDRQEWVNIKVWLLNPRVACWGEGIVESIVFMVLALALWKGNGT